MSESKKPTVSEIRAREQAATEGPWDWEYGVSLRTAWGLTKPNNEYVLRFQGGNDIGICPDPEENMEFIQESRTDLPYLLDLVERMGKALDEYGDHTAPCDVSDTTCTCGWEKARALLEELRNSDD